MNVLTSALDVTIAQYTDRGQKAENQDTLGARVPEGNLLATKGAAIVIADGVSSSAAAKMASQSAVTGFLSDYYATPDTWRTSESAKRVIESLNRYLWSQGRNHIREEGFLTTFSGLILKGNHAFIFHVGDSRIYRKRGEHLEQLTRDHAQKVKGDDSYLTRALGADPILEIDFYQEEIYPGDRFLLTTDGVHESIATSELSDSMDGGSDPETLVEGLVQQALAAGSKDNLSVQFICVNQLGIASQEDTVNLLSQLPFPPLLEKGNKIDGLCVESILQETERSQVYLVTLPDGTKAVMKTPSENYRDDMAYIERFAIEAWIGKRISSRQVVRVLEGKQDRTFLYYLTEFVGGPTLGRLIKERAPIAIPDAVELLEQIISGCRAFHRKDTLHQDLKPDNIIVGKSGAVIIDFGSCWVAGIQEARALLSRESMLGTLSYSAPEYRFGGTISQRSDQFSLAVIFYEMLTGKHPYGEKYEQASNQKAFQALVYTPARHYNPLIPVWMDKALEKSLSISSASRYAALSEWLGDLRRPNLKWLTATKAPLIERRPLLFWQTFSALGWVCAIVALYFVLQ